MLPGDRLVCAFMEPHAVGFRFERWLLHVTVVPWFRLDEASEVIASGLQKALHDIKPFEVALVERAMFGPRKNRPALLIGRPTPFDDIEPKVRGYLHKKRAWLVDETTKRPRQFRPHVTLQKDSALAIGESFKVHTLYIVEQKDDYKEIREEIRLRGPSS
ncbi:MAG TPA: 2'-5' RNA ligase family protein [Candidatus Saccharimonadales bacterium]|nr:2'-5' RNA ligase family protein [Candidatus Saccharimonadales bacterium]